MDPRFGMRYIAQQTAQARMIAAKQQYDDEAADIGTPAHAQGYGVEAGGLWGIYAIIGLIVLSVIGILWLVN